MVKDETAQEEGVQLSKAEFDGLMARINKLENPGVPTRQKRVTEHVATMRMWENCLVVRVGAVKENVELPESSPKRLLWDIVVLNEQQKEKEVTVNYLNFTAHAPKVKVKFLKLESQERFEVDPEKGGGGYGNKRAIDKEGRSNGDFTGNGITGEEVALEVGFIDTTAQVEVLEGTFKGTVVSFTPETINALNI